MARYWELAEEAMHEIRERRNLEKTACGNKFCCRHCGTHFDTSVGKAVHDVYGCHEERQITQEITAMTCCQVCGSYALYREKSGAMTCETCKSSE